VKSKESCEKYLVSAFHAVLLALFAFFLFKEKESVKIFWRIHSYCLSKDVIEYMKDISIKNGAF
jgi:hypothetical protein